MNAEQVRKLAADSLSQLVGALEAGKSEALTRYLATLARFHRYSFGNVLLIACQRPDATRVAGYTRWRELGRFVRQGERGIAIIAPMRIRPRETEEGTPDEVRRDRSLLRFRVVHVFDVSQTEGEPLPEPVRVGGDPNGHTDRLKGLVAESGITLEYADSLGGAEGLSHGGRITLRRGQTPAEEFATLVHEFAHELLHRGEDRPASKTVRETEAEAVAFVVCAAIGLDTGTAASDYIQLYDGKNETLAASLDRIQQTAARILNALLESGGK